jgi:hypothetical protein
MATIRKLMDISGIPFVIEERDGEKFIVGVKVRRQVFKLEGAGLPVDVVDKIEGTAGDNKINGVEEIEDFLEGVPEGSKLKESVPSEFASDDDMISAWQDALDSAKVAAGAGE